MRVNGFARPNRWIAFIRPNDYVIKNYFGSKYGGYSEIADRLAMSCYGVSVPNRTILTHEQKLTYPVRHIPYGLDTNNSSGVSFDFYCRGDYFEKEVFEQWINGIISPQTRLVDFYDDYTMGSYVFIVNFPTSIGTLEETNEFVPTTTSPKKPNMVSVIALTGLYPKQITINDGALNYSPSQEPMKIKVDFMYRKVDRYEQQYVIDINKGIKFIDDNGNDPTKNGLVNLINTGTKMLNMAQGFGLVNFNL